ncbi:MAG: hypothetical protein Q9194_007365 [Teloschistes cf. exilis]
MTKVLKPLETKALVLDKTKIPDEGAKEHEMKVLQSLYRSKTKTRDERKITYELQGPDWKAVASDLSYVLISGDFSSRGYEQLRRAIARHDRIIAKLQDPLLEPDMPSTGWVSAVGAAKTAKERWFEDYMYLQRSHDEL